MISAVVQPVRLALYGGRADPPSPSRLAVRLPQPVGRVALTQAGDAVLALIVFATVLAQMEEWIPRLPVPVTDGYAPVLALGAALPLALRHRWPLAAWRLAFAALPFQVWVAHEAGDVNPPYTFVVAMSYLLVVYAVAVRCEQRVTAAVWVLSVLAAWISHPGSMPPAAVLLTVTALFGYNVRMRRSATVRLALEERRSQEAMGAQAVLEERARIARELHDVVAHHMSVIAIQAEAVPLKAGGDPAQLEAGLAEIRALSLEAIAQLRQVLGVLRDQEGRTDTTPQPGLERVEELVATARATGLTVAVKLPESLSGLPPAVGLSAYRIVQESLSNAMRHAPGATVLLDVSRDEGSVRVHVVNGPGAGPPGPVGAGQGLIGMRERVALLGGTLETGPVPGGGFRVTAVLPAEQGTA